MIEQATKLARETREAVVKMWRAHHRKQEREFELAYTEAHNLLTQLDTGLYADQPSLESIVEECLGPLPILPSR